MAGSFRGIWLLIFPLWAVACNPSEQKRVPANPYESDNQQQVEAAIKVLHTGDVVLRRGAGPFSTMLAELNQKDKSYSHCGIVVVEGGYPFVYHSIGGEDNKDEKLRRDSASFFFSPAHNRAIAVVRYGLKQAQQDTLTDIVHTYYNKHPLFDPKFDLSTDSLLYCSEFLYRVFTAAMHDTGYIPKSTGYERLFIGIDDLFLNPHASFITKVNYR